MPSAVAISPSAPASRHIAACVKYPRSLLLAAIVPLLFGGSAFAQARIEWVGAPSYANWPYQVTASVRIAPGALVSKGYFRTLGEADTRIRQLLAEDASTSWPAYKYAIIRVEVKPGFPRGNGNSGNGGNSQAFSARITAFRNQLASLRNDIGSLRRMLSGSGYSDAGVNNANRVIQDYNNLIAEGRRVFGSSAVSGFTAESPIALRRPVSQSYYFNVMIAGRGQFVQGPFQSPASAQSHWRYLMRLYGRNIRLTSRLYVR
jgi:hypothetical protein